jgi:D-alanyl-D-alanine endopeptidase (penicillin-binding protein 7)
MRAIDLGETRLRQGPLVGFDLDSVCSCCGEGPSCKEPDDTQVNRCDGPCGRDNAAARALARLSPLGYQGFIERMNEKAVELGLTSTTYSDPSGLDSNNVSSAFDIARLIAFAAEDELIGPIMRKPEYSFHTMNTRPRTVTVRSTNEILRAGDMEVRGGKTGFIAQAGYCLATLLKLPEGGPSLAVVVLGATTRIGRFWEARHLLSWLETKAQILSLSTPATLATAVQ